MISNAHIAPNAWMYCDGVLDTVAQLYFDMHLKDTSTTVK